MPQTQCEEIAIAIEVTRFQFYQKLHIPVYLISDKLKSCYFYRYFFTMYLRLYSVEKKMKLLCISSIIVVFKMKINLIGQEKNTKILNDNLFY